MPIAFSQKIFDNNKFGTIQFWFRPLCWALPFAFELSFDIGVSLDIWILCFIIQWYKINERTI